MAGGKIVGALERKTRKCLILFRYATGYSQLGSKRLFVSLPCIPYPTGAHGMFVKCTLMTLYARSFVVKKKTETTSCRSVIKTVQNLMKIQ